MQTTAISDMHAWTAVIIDAASINAVNKTDLARDTCVQYHNSHVGCMLTCTKLHIALERSQHRGVCTH